MGPRSTGKGKLGSAELCRGIRQCMPLLVLLTLGCGAPRDRCSAALLTLVQVRQLLLAAVVTLNSKFSGAKAMRNLARAPETFDQAVRRSQSLVKNCAPSRARQVVTLPAPLLSALRV